MGLTSSTSVWPLRIGAERPLGGEPLAVRSPFDGRVLARVATADTAAIGRAIGAAATALEAPLARHRRVAILDAAALTLQSRRDEVSQVLSAEAGKPIRLAAVEVDRAVATLQASATVARTLVGSVQPLDAVAAGDGRLGWTTRVPRGVVAALTPFNFPLNLVVHKVGPALAVGCSVVLKPSERTPMSSLLLAEILEQAGLPDGWLNVVVGDPQAIVAQLIDDPAIAVITFTGSTRVGWDIERRAARKTVLLELGNVTPAIVHADADVSEAVAKIVPGAFGFAGQSCVSGQRILVHRSRHAEVVAALRSAVDALMVGDPADAATDVGPVIDVASAARIHAWIGEAVAAGAQAVRSGNHRDDAPFVAPTVLLNATDAMRVCAEEIFGPVLTVTAYDAIDDAIRSANASGHGLQAAVFTQDIGVALRAAERLRFGSVLINESPSYRVDLMPYGGVGLSGIGKEGPASAALDMTDEKLIVLDAGLRGAGSADGSSISTTDDSTPTSDA